MFRAAMIVIMIAAGAWWGGIFDQGWSRTIDRPAAAVIESIGSFELSEMEGSPGSDPAYSGGATTSLSRERSDNGWIFTAETGGVVSMTLFADVIDLGDGRSELRARVARGASPEDRTPPMFTDEGITLTLFGAALNERIDRLTLPASFNAATCGRILARLSNEAPPGGDNLERGGFRERLNSTNDLSDRMTSVDRELQANGCSKERMEANRAAVEQAMDEATTGGPFAGAGAAPAPPPPPVHR